MTRHPLLCASLMLALSQPLHLARADAINLPDLGDSSESALSLADEARIGRSILSQIRESSDVVDDAEVNAYLKDIGGRLVAASDRAGGNFTFFMVDDKSINAFALPGGVIGVHTGLLLAAQSEGELASVLAHEIAHVTQRHLARMQEKSSTNQLWMLAALLAGALAARGGNGDVTLGAISAGMGMGISQQLAYSRDMEREADRLGMQTLSRAGFDVRTMAAFFERMQQNNRMNDNNAFAFLRTHPVTTERISEAQNRALSYPSRLRPDSTDFRLAREKVRVLQMAPADAVRYYREALAQQRYLGEGAAWYGLARAALAARDLPTAADALARAQKLLPETPMLFTLEAELAVAQGKPDRARQVYRKGIEAFPANRALLGGEVALQFEQGRVAEARERVQALLKRYPSDPDLYRLLARSYADGDALRYHAALGNAFYFEQRYESALVQYRLASGAPGEDFYLRSVIEARMREAEREKQFARERR